MNDQKCPVTGGKCPFDETQFGELVRKIDQIHAYLFGIESQGGMSRRVDQIEVRLNVIETWRSRIAGIAATVGAIATFALTKLWDWITK